VISLTYYTGDAPDLTAPEVALYGRNDPVRQAVRSGIRRWVAENRELLSGRVLDYGCGKPGTCAIPQPYRAIINADVYTPWEPGDARPLNGTFDGILCTQVLQLVDDPAAIVRSFLDWLKPAGHLVMTYPVAWEEIETERWRFTKHGMWALVHAAGFEVARHECIANVVLDGSLNLAMVNGIVCRK
jgi:2-polyprenyl-3-methyl-5-hydroxy-6-metoxy-1,4-benzoquinol methylase